MRPLVCLKRFLALLLVFGLVVTDGGISNLLLQAEEIHFSDQEELEDTYSTEEIIDTEEVILEDSDHAEYADNAADTEENTDGVGGTTESTDGVDAINISLAGYKVNNSELLKSVIDESTSQGVPVIVSSGNYGEPTDNDYPACILWRKPLTATVKR